MRPTNKLQKFLASKIPAMKLLWTDRYGMNIPNGNKTRKTILPPPDKRRLRNLSREPVVRKAMNIISDAVSSMPYTIDVIAPGRRKYTKEIAVIQNVIEHPNVIDSRRSFIKRIMDDALVLDAMVVESVKSSDGNHPVYLYPVDAGTIKLLEPWDYTNPHGFRYVQNQGDGVKKFTADNIFYGTRQNFTDTHYGCSPVRYAYKYISDYIEACARANDIATNTTSSFLIGLRNAKPEEIDKFRDYMNNEIEGTGHIPIVGSTEIDSRQIRSINKDNLGIDWIDRLTKIIAMSFSIPPEELGITIQNDRSTEDDRDNSMTEGAIKPYAYLLEDLYNNYVIAKMGLGGVLRFRFIHEDSENQKTAKSTRLVNEYKADLITENEFRALSGYEESSSKYANMTHVEKTANINVDLGLANGGGFNGVGDLKDNTKDDTGSDKDGDSG